MPLGKPIAALSLVAAAIFLIAPPAIAQQPDASDEAQPIIDYSRDPKTVIFQFDLVGDFSWPTPFFRLYGDGRILLYRYPDTHRIQLTKAEMESLWKFLYDKGVLTFDKRAVEAKCWEILEERNERRQSLGQPLKGFDGLAGGAYSIFTVRLIRFRGAGDNESTQYNLKHHFAWDALHLSIKQFPTISELRDLLDASTYLFEFRERNDLTLVPPGQTAPDMRDPQPRRTYGKLPASAAGIAMHQPVP